MCGKIQFNYIYNKSTTNFSFSNLLLHSHVHIFYTTHYKHHVICQSILQTLKHTKLFTDTDQQSPMDLDTF